MKIRARILTCALTISMLAGLGLSGCMGNGKNASTASGGSSSSDNVVVKDLGGRMVKFYVWGYNPDTANDTVGGRTQEQIFSEIRTKFNCDLKIVAGPTDSDYNTLWNSIMSGSPIADIVDGIAPHLISSPLKNNCYMALDDLGIDLTNLSFNADVMKYLNYGGKQYGITPINQTAQGLYLNQVFYFNKRLVKEAGYEPDDLYKWQQDGSWIWSKFEEVALKIAQLSTDANPVYGTVGNDGLLYSNLVVSNGTDWILKNTDGTGYTFNGGDAKAIEALEFYKKLYTEKIIPATEAFSDAQMFLDGKAGFLPDYLERAQYKNTYGSMKDDYGILLFPKGPKETDYKSMDNWFNFYGIATGAQNPSDLAMILNYYCVKSSEYGANDTDTIQTMKESLVRDQQSINTINMISSKSMISATYISGDIRADWIYTQIQAVKKGEVTPAEAVEQRKSGYAQTLKDLFDLSGN